MRRVKIFSGSSHPLLTAAICEKLGTQPSKCDLSKFSNGETSVIIGTSIRDQDVFIVQSGSKSINDSIMELLIMASACKGGSARSITAVIPYFPYSRQSKKKSHRGAITARMLASLLTVAGVHHVITVDLHAPPMQGFFNQPVDNLYAEQLIARWIRNHVPDWHEAIVVSKNAGGSKRVTSLADALKLSFGIIMTDRRRDQMSSSMMIEGGTIFGGMDRVADDVPRNAGSAPLHNEEFASNGNSLCQRENSPQTDSSSSGWVKSSSSPHMSPRGLRSSNGLPGASPLHQSMRAGSGSPNSRTRLPRRSTAPIPLRHLDLEESNETYNDERAREVITGRLIQGHIVDDDYPSPNFSTISGSVGQLALETIGAPRIEEKDPMVSSFMSTISSNHGDALGGTFDATASDAEEEEFQNPELEHTITLVGNVKDRTVLIIDDMIDRSESWIAAAETVVKRGGANKVYCIATHGLFGEDSLENMEACDCIDHIIVCNTFPIDEQRIRSSKKLVILDLSGLLSEAIRRNHHGESISQLYQFYQD